MSLEAIITTIPYVIPAGSPLVNSVIEDSITALETLQPNLIFMNRHLTEDMILTVVRRVDLGTSAQPELDCTVDTTVINAVTVSAGEDYVYEPPISLVKRTTTPSSTHLVSISHAHATDDLIVLLLVTGMVVGISGTPPYSGWL